MTDSYMLIWYQCQCCNAAMTTPTLCTKCGGVFLFPVSALAFEEKQRAEQEIRDEAARVMLREQRLLTAPFPITTEFDAGPPPSPVDTVPHIKPRTAVTGKTMRIWRDDQGEKSAGDVEREEKAKRLFLGIASPERDTDTNRSPWVIPVKKRKG